MTLDQINRWRQCAGRAAAFCCLLFCLSALDGLSSRFGRDPNELRLLPGEAASVNGSASEGVQSPQDLTVTSDSNQIHLAIEQIHTGFWLGGLMWRGTLTTSSTIGAGDYTVAVKAGSDLSGKPLATFRVSIFADAASLQKSAASIIQRTAGMSPWWSAVLFFVVAAGSAGIVFLLSQQREHLLRQEGKAEIYRISGQDGAYEVSFALGTRQGVRVGSKLTLLDQSGLPVGSVIVREAYEEDSTATVSVDCQPEPGFIVALS